jgi:TonB-dependent receptor
MWSLLLVYSQSGFAATKEQLSDIAFHIPRQRADLSLISFAEQANITLLFPLDKISDQQTNPLLGLYSLSDALAIMLKDTGLQAQISESGQVSILIDPTFKSNHDMADYNKNKVATAVLAVLSTVVTAPALAGQEKETKEAEVIEIRGIRGSLGRAMDAKREAGGVVDSISAEDIGKFPDTNLAESLQRISGVSIDRSGGEGQLITVRGFGPEFNTVLVNGRQMASENQSRAFSFDTIASELVRSLDVHKTSTAGMQSGGIGSTVNVITARPFAIGGFKVAGSVKAVYDENSEKNSPQISALISDTFADESFGALVAISHQQRDTRLDQAQIDGWLENVGVPNPVTQSGQAYSGNIFSPRNYDHKVTTEQRERTNANLVLQFAPSDSLVLTADALYSDFDIEADTTSYGHWFTAPNLTGFGGAKGPTVDGNGTVIDLYQEVGIATDMHAKKFDRLTDTISLGFNADWDYSDQLKLTFDASHSSAEREPNNGRGDQLSLIGYANRVRLQVDDNMLPLASEFAAANPLIYSGQQEINGTAYQPGVTPAGVSNHLDPANSKAHVMLRRGWAVEDTVDQLRWDGIWNENATTGLTKAKFGASFSSENKALERWDNEGVGIHCTFCGYPDLPAMAGFPQYVFDAGSDFLSGASGSGRMPTSWLAHDGEANFLFLQQYAASIGKNINFDAVKRNKSYEVTEDTSAFYLELDFEGELAGMLLTSTAGVRYERTSVAVDGTDAPVTGLSILDETEMLAQFGNAQAINAKANYEAILPNFSVKLDISDEVVARFAASQTLTRPTLESMSPVTVIGTTRPGGDLTSTSGNPELDPFSATNLDLSLEWYYADASYLSGGYFRKNVSNFIVNTTEDKTFTLADGSQLKDPSSGSNTGAADSADSVAVFTNTLPNNGESAIVDGFELAVQHSFDSGFGVMANATLVDSNAKLEPANINQVFALTGLSDSYNLVAFYEQGPFQTRLAYNWRDSFVQSLTQSNGDGVVIVEEYAQLDASASYDVLDNLTVVIEGINLGNEYVHKRGRFANHLLLIEDSGRRIAFGVRGTF